MAGEYEKTEYEKSRTCFKVASGARDPNAHFSPRFKHFCRGLFFRECSKVGRQRTKSRIEINGEACPLRSSGKSYGLPQIRLFLCLFPSPPPPLSLSCSLFCLFRFFLLLFLVSLCEGKAAHERSRIFASSRLTIVRLNRRFPESRESERSWSRKRLTGIHLRGFHCEIFQESRMAELSLRNSEFRMGSRVYSIVAGKVVAFRKKAVVMDSDE